MSARSRRVRLAIEPLELRLTPDGNSAGDLGIQAAALWNIGLTGQGIFIGQIEPDRTAAPSINGQPFDSTYHPDVQPERVYLIDQPGVKDKGYDWHPTGVAGVMISRSSDPAKQGIAKDAKAP